MNSKQFLYYRFYWDKLYLKYYNHETNKYYSDTITNINYHFFIKHPNGESNYRDTKLKKVSYTSIKEYNEKIKTFQRYEIHNDYHPAYKYMIDNFQDMKSDFDKIRYCVYDIETPYIKDVNNSEVHDAPINSIAIYSSIYKKSVVLGLKKSKRPNHIYCRTEKELLVKFSKIFKLHDLSVGFNNEWFDMRYIINRIIILFGKNADKMLSPFNQPHKTKYVKDVYGDYKKYEVVGITDVDVKILLKMYYKPLARYSLEYASQVILGRSKIHHEESFIQMYEDFYEKHVEYNDVDVLNTKDILEYLQYIPKIFDLSYRSKYIVTHASDTTASYDVLIFNFKRDDRDFVGKNVPKRTPREEHQSRGYMGGFVQDPKRGRSGWGLSRDANSLYPTDEQIFNISFDTKIDRDKVPTEIMDWLYQHSDRFNVYNCLTNSSAKTISFEQVIRNFKKEFPNIKKDYPKEYFNILYRVPEDTFYKEILFATVGLIIDMDMKGFTPLLERHNLCMTPNIVFYDTTKEGLYPEMMRIFYSDRSKLKDERDKFVKQITEEEKRLYLLFNSGQSTLKLFMNRGYGATGTETFRWYDIDVANSITSGGQILIRTVLKAVDLALQEYMGDTKSRVSYGDTDSGYFDVDDIVQKDFTHLKTDVEIAEAILDFSNKFLDSVVDKAVSLVTHKLNARVRDIFIMKVEKVYRSAIFFKRKKYVVDKIYDEGKIYPNGDISPTGISTVSIGYSAMVTSIKNKAISLIMAGDYDVFLDWYKDMKYKRFRLLSPDEIAMNKKINNLDKYIKPFTEKQRRQKQTLIKAGRYFEGSDYYVELRTLPQLRGVALHNSMIDRGVIRNTYKISNGSMVKMIYLKESKRREPVFCYTTEEGSNILKKNMIDYNKMFDVNVGKEIQKYLDNVNWRIM